MAYPDDIPNLHSWWRADQFFGAYTDGEDITTIWYPLVGGVYLTPSAAPNSPVFREDQIGGQPAVELSIPSGENRSFYRTSVTNWRNNLQNHTLFVVWYGTAVGGGILSSDGGSGSDCIVHRDVSGTPHIAARYAASTPKYAQTPCPLDSWHFAVKRQTYNSKISISLDGGAEVETTGIGAWGPTYPTNNVMYIGSDGAATAKGLFAEGGIYSASLSDTHLKALQDYLRARYFAVTPAQNEQVRDVLSRRLWVRRRAPGVLSVSAPLWMLDADILDRIALEAEYGPAPAGAGWRAKKWARRAFSIQRMGLSEDGDRVMLELLDRRPLDVFLWDTGMTNEPALILNATRQSGVARLLKGNTVTFTRATRAWVLNPADDSAVIEIQQGERALTSLGEYLEEERTNELLRSSFVSGTTGLTLGGTGTNGSSIDTDPDDQFFNPEMGAESLKFTAGDPHSADLTCQFPATASIPANTKLRLSIDHKTDSGEPLHVRLTRGVDGYYWNDSTPGWQAGAVDNALPSQADRDPADRWISEEVDVGGSATTLTLTVLLPSGGTASRVSHLYHVQLEEGSHPTSRIVSDDEANTRDKSELSIDVPAAQKIFDPELGCFYCEVLTDWSSSELGTSEDRYVFWMTTNGGADHDCLFYDASAGAWVLERKVGGSTYQATKTATVTRDTLVKLAARWTGAEDELDLTAYTISIFVDGVKGTDDVAAAPTFDAGGETLYLGADSSHANQLNGARRETRVFPAALTDEELARLP